MFFIRHSRLFNRKGDAEQCLVCHKRSEGRLKRYESCTDTRAWSLDSRERASYVLDLMSSIAREDKLNKEKALEDISPQGKVSPSGFGKEYTSEAVEHVGALHGESVGVALQSGNLPLKHIEKESEEGIHDDISESSLHARKFTRIAALQLNPAYDSEAIQSETQFEETIGGEDETLAIGTEDETLAIGGEDETLPYFNLNEEPFEESTFDDISKSSLHGGKFTRIAALGPNPARVCACSDKKELPKENIVYGKQSGVPLQYSDTNAEKKSHEAIQSETQFEETIGGQDETLAIGTEDETLAIATEDETLAIGTEDETLAIGGEDETLPYFNLNEEPFEETSFDDISKSSLHGRKFTRIAALGPNPARVCGCSDKKELLNVPKENIVYGKQSGVPLQYADIKVEKKSDDAIQSENQFQEKIRGEDETLPVDRIKQESVAEDILNDVFESSLHGQKFTRFAALRPNPARNCVCSAAAELLASSKGNVLYTVSLQPPNTKAEKKSNELLNSSQGNAFYTVSLQPLYIEAEKMPDETFHKQNLSFKKSGAEAETNPPFDNIKQESVAEDIIKNVFESSLNGEKFTHIAALRPNPELMTLANEYVYDVVRNSVSLKKEQIGSHYKHVMPNEKITYSAQLTSSAGLKKHEDEALALKVERDSYREQMDLPSTKCPRKVVKGKSFVLQEEMGYHSFVEGSPATSSKHSALKEENSVSEENPSVQYVSVSKSPHISVIEIGDETEISAQDRKEWKNFDSEQMNQPPSGCSCNATMQPSHMLKADKSLVNVPIPEAERKAYAAREMNGYDDSKKNSSQYAEDNISFDSESDCCKQRVHACREANPAGSVLQEEAVLPGSGMEYILIPVPQEQEAEFNFLEMEVGNYDPAKQASHMPKKHKLTADVPDFEAMAVSVSEMQKQGDIPVPYGKMNVPVGGNMDSSQYGEENISYSESDCCMQRVHACREAMPAGSVLKEEAVLPGSAMVYFLIPVPQGPRAEFSFSEKEVQSNGIIKSEVNGSDGGNIHNGINSNHYTEEEVSFETEGSSKQQHMCACREAKKVGSVQQEETDLPACGRVYFLIPVSQVQDTEFNAPGKEGNIYGDKAKETEKLIYGDKSPVNVPTSEIKIETFTIREMKSDNESYMGSSRYIVDDISFDSGTDFAKLRMCGYREAREVESSETSVRDVMYLDEHEESLNRDGNIHMEESEKLVCGDKLSVNVPTPEIQITASTVGKMKSYDESKMDSIRYIVDDISFDSRTDFSKLRIYGCREAREVESSETSATDVMHLDEHGEPHHRDGNIHSEESEKLLRSFDVERKFYKEQMDTAIRKLNDRVKETEALRAERDSLKTDLDAAQHYIKQHKKAVDKLNSMRKVDEQLSRENEVLLKKIYQLSYTAFNQQTTISKLKNKLKQKSKNCSYVQNSNSSGKGSGEFKPVHILYPTSKNNLMVPHKSVFLESYSQYPLKNSTSDAASRYNMSEGDRSSFSHMNANRAFVEETVNHLQITAITDHNPQNKKYLDLKQEPQFNWVLSCCSNMYGGPLQLCSSL
ncbi:uncharacterized protein LOC126364314 isoform X3 [Schistocerca gregaria]|uniref:uncharacterized protein LOC126364314 isoform X3 n=1 Tax=Schistocerca gregaria TaxID=7010 RepID=UPI00211E70E2|nr:uncharacterized protein LOC126364314 isoform X3 [Schistocerca gregaria]